MTTRRVARRVLLPAAAALWAAAVLLASSFLSWWLALALLLALLAALPLLVRLRRRALRLAAVAEDEPRAATGAWAEVLDAATDHGVDLPERHSLRGTAELLGQRVTLDDEARAHLRTVVTELERAWYAAEPDAAVRAEHLSPGLRGVRDGLRRARPVRLVARWWPRSVLGRLRRRWPGDTNAPAHTRRGAQEYGAG